MAIDLCVVSFNNSRELPRLLDHLDDGLYPSGNGINWSLYLADNDSSDGTKQALEEIDRLDLLFNGARPVIFLNQNIGYARACNQLASQGKGNIIGFLNADVWMSSESILRIEEAFRMDDTISILGPKQRDETGYITHAGIEGKNTSARPRAWKLFDPMDKKYRFQEEMISVAGSAYFIRREVWDFLSNCKTYRTQYPEATGAMLETDLYYEETFLSYHARHHGFKVMYDGRISIGHSWHSSSPVGSQVHKFKQSQKIFREACDFHGISHD